MREKFCAVLVLLCLTTAVQANRFEMDTLETDDLRMMYFDPQHTYLTPHAARSFQNSLEFQRYIFNWTPYERTTIMLEDYIDEGNAVALSSPRNVIWIDIAPLNQTFETFPAVERMYLLMNHEMVHVATGDGWNQQDFRWRRFFGGKPYASGVHPESIIYAYLTAPRNAAPRWYFEGSAVFMETWMSGGFGRAQGAYDEMVFRAMVRDNATFYDNLGIVSEGSAIDFQTMLNAYLYGTRFFSYLAFTWSPEQVIEWLSRGEESKRYYSDQFRNVFGESLEDVWDKWIVFEKEYQAVNLASVRQYPLTEKQPLVEHALGSVSRSFVDEDARTLLGGFYFPGVVGHIGVMSLEDGGVRHLADIDGPMKFRVTSTALDPKTNTLFYTADNITLRDLMAMDVTTGETQMLMEDERIGHLAFNPADDSLWGVRHINGYVMLVRIPKPYDSWYEVFTWPYGQVMSDLDISPDGSLMSATVGEISGNQFLRVFRISDLLLDNTAPIAQFDFGRAIPEGFVFSPDGRYLFGSSYYTGVSNIFRYEIANGEIEAVSNAETGFFRPIPLSDGSLIVFEYTGNGFIPTRIDPVPLQDLGTISLLGNEIVKKHPVVQDWSVGSPADIDLDSMITKRGKYIPYKELGYTWGYPIIEGYRDSVAPGFSFTLQDPLMYDDLRVDLSYSVDGDLEKGERFHADVDYIHMFWHYRYRHNYANFYDLFGPIERSRKGDSYMVAYNKPVIFDLPRRMDFHSEVTYYTGLDTLPGNQNVDADFTELLSAEVGLKYSNTKRSLGAIDHEKGYIWEIEASADHAQGDTFPKLRAGLDFGFALPLKHSSIWFYNAAGFGTGDRENSLANWYFGSFGNNYVDDREVQRYRQYYSLPGFEIDQIASKNFAKSVLEWSLPPLRFKSVGTPSFYLTHLRTALFAGAMLTDIGSDEYDEFYSSIGFQLDLEFTIVHRLPMIFSIGFARGFIDGHKADDEFMLSLKIL